ncbi:MAG: hypothetical protein KGS72_00735 [Cyanobacteria bacterium REEB67]|nr:hypothetical protein [Cyanobacteria bacterium REEB67]
MDESKTDRESNRPDLDVIGHGLDHLVEGGIYSVLANQYGKGDFVLAKVVHLNPGVVHVVIFPPSFKHRPGSAELSHLSLAFDGGLNEARDRHVAMTRKLFSLIRPVYVRDEPISDNDLAGFRRWSLMPEKEILEAPTYIEPEANRGVYKRIFLFCGLPFGLLQGIYHYCRDGLVPGVCAFIFGFAIFGAGMVVTQHLAVQKRTRKNKSDLALPQGVTASLSSCPSPSPSPSPSASAFQVAEVEINQGFGDTFALCQQAIRTVKNCRVLEEDFSGGTVEGRVGFSLTSEGEQIVLTSYVIGPEQTGVVIASMPRAGGEVDLGKNFDNVARIVSHLKTACK